MQRFEEKHIVAREIKKDKKEREILGKGDIEQEGEIDV